MRLSIDPQRCQGHGQCEAVAPALFGLGPDGFAYLVKGEDADVAQDERPSAEDAIAMCPEMAISWRPATG